jgi:DNA invertase Pin-like site-specific DNA recombinase
LVDELLTPWSRRSKQGVVRVVGYARVSTDEQAASGAGMAAQREGIERETRRRGWHLIAIHADRGASGRSLDGRPGLSAALSAVAGGEADALVVLKLDRLSRSLVDFAGLLERARREKWALVAVDLGVDTTSPSGELVANVMASVAQWERRVIGERTREALAVRRAQGVRLGRPRVTPTHVRHRVAEARARGLSYRAIAAELNGLEIPTAHGGRAWHAETVRKLAGGATDL